MLYRLLYNWKERIVNKGDIIQAIETGRQQLEALWAGATEAQMTTLPGPQADWSVKDLIAHLTYWEQTMLGNVGRLLRGEDLPGGETPPREDIDTVNARVLNENRERPLADVLAAFRQSREQVIERVRGLPEDDLERRFAWLHHEPLHTYIAGDTFEHYQDHLSDLRHWHERMLTQ
jgi:uncharacterized protein (TIGR03083 family)